MGEIQQEQHTPSWKINRHESENENTASPPYQRRLTRVAFHKSNHPKEYSVVKAACICFVTDVFNPPVKDSLPVSS